MGNVMVIPARRQVGNNIKKAEKPKLRVAAYCRVSTDSEEQLTSYEAQMDYYTNYIKSRPEWEFAGVYTEIKLAYLLQKIETEYWEKCINKGFRYIQRERKLFCDKARTR